MKARGEQTGARYHSKDENPIQVSNETENIPILTDFTINLTTCHLT